MSSCERLCRGYTKAYKNTTTTKQVAAMPPSSHGQPTCYTQASFFAFLSFLDRFLSFLDFFLCFLDDEDEEDEDRELLAFWDARPPRPKLVASQPTAYQALDLHHRGHPSACCQPAGWARKLQKIFGCWTVPPNTSSR
jgi:hypothetical protein